MDPLAQLKDIHLPDPVGLWPLAWGWWVLLAVLIIVVGTLIYLRRRHSLRNRYRAAALAELHNAKAEFDQHQDVAAYLQRASIILRRAALSGCANNYHPNLKGEAWLQWLDEQYHANLQLFTHGHGRALLTGPYEAKPTADVAQVHQLVRLWLKEHRNQWQQHRAKKATEKTLLPTRAQPTDTEQPAEARNA